MGARESRVSATAATLVVTGRAENIPRTQNDVFKERVCVSVRDLAMIAIIMRDASSTGVKYKVKKI